MSVTKTESEKVVGKDQWDIPIIECSDKVNLNVKGDRLDSKANGKYWFICPECGNTCWREVNGKTYYHLLSCSQANGIGYNSERIEDVRERLGVKHVWED
jgi:predicted RNA-binding Zn-ribbon protein involved in translation (DUF1610 family)